MPYETSYDTGLKPFNHDKNRGKWSSPKDFLFACIGHAFKVDAILVLPADVFNELGIYALIPYLLTLGVCVIPIVLLQSFLGQFSSTGFLSVFRISPLFKGIGYVSLSINLLTLTYYSIFGAIPLFYFFNTLRPTIPWSCEGAAYWMNINENTISVCTKNSTHENYIGVEIPSLEFFKLHLNTIDIYDRSLPERTFSWSLVICSFIILGMAAAVLIKPIEFIGQFLRYSSLTVIGILSLCVLRLLFLPGSLTVLKAFIQPVYLYLPDAWAIVPLIAMSALGPGWGSVLTMASYNNFKTNIFRYSWILCLAQVGIVLGLSFVTNLITSLMRNDFPESLHFIYFHAQWLQFLIIPTGLTFLELPHFWSLIFFTMLILGCLNLLIIKGDFLAGLVLATLVLTADVCLVPCFTVKQLQFVLTSLFDEYEILRGFKREVTLATVGVLSLASIYFCSNHGIRFFETLVKHSIMIQMVLNLLLLLVVLWIYGRERFQRDMKFMINRIYSTWMVNILRLVAPIFLLLGWLIGCAISIRFENPFTSPMVYFVLVMCVLVPCLLIPGYCIFKIMQTSGMLRIRFRRCVRPTDWYPVDPFDRQRYEEILSNTDFLHQLTTETVE